MTSKTASVVAVIGFFCLLSLVPLNAMADFQLSWNAPSQNVDSTPVTDLAGYHLRQSTTSGNYSSAVLTSISANTALIVTSSFTAGATYYFTVTAFDTSGNESGPSNELSYTQPSNATPTPTATPSPSPGPTSAPTPTPTPSPTAPAAAVYRDFDGDGASDLLLIDGSKIDVLLAGSDGSFSKAMYSNDSKSASVVGSVLDKLSGKNQILTSTVERTKGVNLGTFRWDLLDPMTGGRSTLGHFGKKSDLPVIGCQDAGTPAPASMITAAGKITFQYLSHTGAVVKRSMAPETTAIFCSFEPSGTSRVFALLKLKSTTAVELSNLTGSKKIRSASLKTTHSGSFILPASGIHPVQFGVLRLVKGGVELSRLNESTKKWNVQTVAAKISRISNISTGVDSNATRWLALTLTSGSRYLLRFSAQDQVTIALQ